MTIPEILLLLAEIAAARAVVLSQENVLRRDSAISAWMSALQNGAADRAFHDYLQKLHEWRKAEIAKASAKVRASFGITPGKESPCTHTGNRAAME